MLPIITFVLAVGIMAGLFLGWIVFYLYPECDKIFAEQKPAKVKLYIPKDHVVDALTLFDEWMEDSKNSLGGTVAKYKFWTFIGGLLPDAPSGRYVVDTLNARRPYIEKVGDFPNT